MPNTITKSVSTKSKRLAEFLTQEIQEGKYIPGTLLPTDRELAHRYKVSTNTVRKCLDILRDRGTVIREPQRGVVVANPIGPETRLRTIAFISPVASTIANELVTGLTEALDYDRFILAAYVTHEDPEKYRRTVAHIAEQRPCGVVVWDQGRSREHVDIAWEYLSRARIPVVGLGPHSIPNLTADYVRVCEADAGTLIARYLIRRNIRDVAFLCTTSRTDQGERIEAIRKELAKARASLPDDRIFFVDAPHTRELPPDPYIDAREFMARLLDQGFRCPCMIFGHDDPTVGALHAILQAGISVPDEMKLISCGRSEVQTVSPLKLTTCFLDFAEQGRKAAEILMRRIDGFDGPPEVHYTPTTLIEGETT